MQKTLKFGGLIVAAVLLPTYTVAQNATSTAVGNVTAGSTASSCYDAGYQSALANPGKTCPSGHSYNYCAGWAHAREKR